MRPYIVVAIPGGYTCAKRHTLGYLVPVSEHGTRDSADNYCDLLNAVAAAGDRMAAARRVADLLDDVTPRRRAWFYPPDRAVALDALA